MITLSELKALVEGASDLPWVYEPDAPPNTLASIYGLEDADADDYGRLVLSRDRVCFLEDNQHEEANAALICAAVSITRALVDDGAVERAARALMQALWDGNDLGPVEERTWLEQRSTRIEQVRAAIEALIGGGANMPDHTWRERLEAEALGFDCAAEAEQAVAKAMQPYVEVFHADDRSDATLRRVRVSNDARANLKRFEQQAADLRSAISVIDSQALEIAELRRRVDNGSGPFTMDLTWAEAIKAVVAERDEGIALILEAEKALRHHYDQDIPFAERQEFARAVLAKLKEGKGG